MTDAWTVPATVVKVLDGSRLQLRLDLGWRLRLDITAHLIGVHTPPGDTDEGEEARRFLTRMLEAAGGAPDGSGTDVTFVCHVLDARGSHGQVLTTTPQGEMFDLGMMLLNDGLGVPDAT